MKVRDSERRLLSSVHLNPTPPPPRHAADSTAGRQLACVTRETEKKDYIKMLLGHAGNFPHDLLQITKIRNILFVNSGKRYSVFLHGVVG